MVVSDSAGPDSIPFLVNYLIEMFFAVFHTCKTTDRHFRKHSFQDIMWPLIIIQTISMDCDGLWS